jgi:eukaryotic-like serine/threonine-protein kinase
MEGKTTREWVESKVTDPPPPPEEPLDPQLLGIPKVGDDILAGKYRIERMIGIGGMGVVMAALHKQLGQQVAIKFLSATMQTPEMVDRFIREGQAAVRIKSEHIAPVLDVGVLETGTPYLMMEHLSGADLSDYLAERGPLPWEDAIDFILQACAALAVAHSSGIVHRDLKPSNLFMTQRSDGTPLIKVLDFGISKIGKRAGQPDPKSTLTRPGMMLGSPRYMSPEQLRNASTVDLRADIWAIGIVLHELITGTPPYDADTFSGLCAMIASDPPTRLRTAKPEAPEALEAVILRCLEKDPGERWQNVAELATALAPLAPEESRVIAHRINKILGHVPTKTPPGTYGATKVSPGATPTPKPNDRTLPLGPGSGDGQRISNPSPMASTPVPTAGPPLSSSSSSGAPVPSSENPSHVAALAVSNARMVRRSGVRLGGIAVVLGLLGAIGITLVVLRRPRPIVEPTSAATAAPPPPTSAIPEPAPPAESHLATPTALPAEGSASSPAVTAAPGRFGAPVPPPTQAAVLAGAKRGPPPPAGRPSSSASATPPPPASPATTAAQPSEADMLNRRR